ncbi:sensor histidine kinase [Bifidobacterium oedipodis]|nr:histidine kinase [Bifidobacterium sp. DSM 109957]
MLSAMVITMLSAAHMAVAGSFLLPGDILLPLAMALTAVCSHEGCRFIGLVLGLFPILALWSRVAWHDMPTVMATAVSVAVLVLEYGGWLIGLRQGHARRKWRQEHRRSELLEWDYKRHAELSAMEERQRITREMHDILAHALTAILIQAESGGTVAVDKEEQEIFRSIAGIARQSIGDIRSLLDHIDSQPVMPEPGFAELSALIARFRADGLHVAFANDGPTNDLPPGLGLSVYRVLEESLTNALRYGSTPTALAVLRHNNRDLTLTVENPIVEKTMALASTGRGLEAMRQRCRQYDGDLTYHRGHGRFVVMARWRIPSISGIQERDEHVC